MVKTRHVTLDTKKAATYTLLECHSSGRFPYRKNIPLREKILRKKSPKHRYLFRKQKNVPFGHKWSISAPEIVINNRIPKL